MKNTIKEFKPIQVGQKIYNNSMHSCAGYGIVYEIIGEQNPANTKKTGFIHNVTGQARFKVVYETYFTDYYESSLHDSFIEILDEIVSQREIEKAFVIAKTAIAEEEEKKRLKNEAIAKAVKKNIEANPHLKTIKDFKKISRQALAAKNMKIELRKAFPGQKFSVKSDSFSMGDSVHVSWTDGPQTKDIDSIINKYQYGHFNGMEDIYEMNNDSVWPSDFGSTKYASSSREYSEESKVKSEEYIKKYDTEKFQSYELDQKKWAWLSEQDFYIKPEKPVKTVKKAKKSMSTKKQDLCQNQKQDLSSKDLEPEKSKDIKIVENKKFNGIEIYFPGKPDTDIRDTLKSAGFRWHRVKKCWYAKKSDKTVKAANKAAGIDQKEKIKPEPVKTPFNIPCHKTVCNSAGQDVTQIYKDASKTVFPENVTPLKDFTPKKEPVEPIEPKVIMVDELPDDIRYLN